MQKPLSLLTEPKILKALPGVTLQFMCSGLFPSLAFLISPYFFKDSSIVKGFLAAGLIALARPIGGYWFGVVADKLGSYTSLFYCRILSGLVNILIALLPQSDFSGTVLALLLFIQGLAFGGDHGSSLGMSVEEKVKDEYQCTAYIVAFGMIGSLVSLLMASFVNSISFLEHSWKICFLVSGTLVFFSAFFTPKDKISFSKKSVQRESLFRKNQFQKVVFGIFLGVVIFCPIIFSSYYTNFYISENFAFSSSWVLLNNALSLFFGIILIFISPKIIQIIGFKNTLYAGISLCVLGIIIFRIFPKEIVSTLIFQYTLAAGDALLVVPLSKSIPMLFEKEHRSQATGFCYATGGAIAHFLPSLFIALS